MSEGACGGGGGGGGGEAGSTCGWMGLPQGDPTIMTSRSFHREWEEEGGRLRATEGTVVMAEDP